MGAANRNGLRRSTTLEQREEVIAAAAEQRYAEFTGGETLYTGGTVHELKVALLGRGCLHGWARDGHRRWSNGAAIIANPIDP